jgi:Domain of unknown function (DUF4390)
MQMMVRRATVLTVLLVLSAVAFLCAEETLRITPFVRDNKVLVTFELDDAFTQAVHEAIASGLRTTFSYDLELRTVVPGWIDRTIARTVVSTTDQYDNLTRRHTLTRIVDGRIEDSITTDDESVVKAWLTKWTRVPVSDTSRLDPARDYYVQITTRARPLGGSLLGLSKSITGSAKFTFIP